MARKKENLKSGPLKGVKIIDFTRLLPGPLATMFLADMGADVIKVEDPGNPDYVRNFAPHIKGISVYYLALNRSKRSLAVNYNSEQGKQIIYDLIKGADVVIEQFRPGTMKEWRMDYKTLSKINPLLIYVAITGYGQDSSLAQKAGHDLNYMAKAGLLYLSPSGDKMIPDFQAADIAGGSYMAMNAVTAALYQREKTHKGEFVDLSMTDAVLPLNILQFAQYQVAKDRGSDLSGGLPNYNVYDCKDNAYIVLGGLEPKFWNKFCARVGKPEWININFKTAEEEIAFDQEVMRFFQSKRAKEWERMFKNDDICFTVVNKLWDLEKDAYLNERKMFVEHEHPVAGKYKTINQPIKFKGTTGFNNNSKGAPELGEDTVAILKEINYTGKRINELEKNQIIKIY